MDLRTAWAVGILLTVGNNAVAFCSKPDAPYCASRYGAFDDEYEFSRCKSEMESYKSDVEDFVSCVKREIEDLTRQADDLTRQGDTAVDEYQDTVSSFNRRAGS